jgi:splicing factor 3A subunit 2
MVQLIVNALGKLKTIDVDGDDNITELHNNISICFGIPVDKYYLSTQGGKILPLAESISSHLVDGSSITMKLRIVGGIDFQHREGSKIGSGGQLSESQAAIERRERLRKLALETIDITKDPYIMRNHLGTFECKLCLTLHNNEGNYLAHTQGKRHQVIRYKHTKRKHR